MSIDYHPKVKQDIRRAVSKRAHAYTKGGTITVRNLETGEVIRKEPPKNSKRDDRKLPKAKRSPAQEAKYREYRKRYWAKQG